jgi:hypothetical protein
MNAEFLVETSYTVEFETQGVALTVFSGPDSDGAVYIAPYDKLVEDLVEMCTYDEAGSMESGDREYLERVRNALVIAVAQIDKALDVGTD